MSKIFATKPSTVDSVMSVFQATVAKLQAIFN